MVPLGRRTGLYFTQQGCVERAATQILDIQEDRVSTAFQLATYRTSKIASAITSVAYEYHSCFINLFFYRKSAFAGLGRRETKIF